MIRRDEGASRALDPRDHRVVDPAVLGLPEIDDAVPAFLTVAVMPFTSSIANGIALGILAHVVLRVLLGRWRDLG